MFNLWNVANPTGGTIFSSSLLVLAASEALEHSYFKNHPLPTPVGLLPKLPSKQQPTGASQEMPKDMSQEVPKFISQEGSSAGKSTQTCATATNNPQRKRQRDPEGEQECQPVKRKLTFAE
ncbi:unnamed protein product [Ostreobium quekettii]|uniref:Uncharacterized protein n=1 Tax=Ostreobium quekettii TaxID=121088 RepID=A0A8S1IQ57_9CHLO|nr:unnamed protein product [Ostreobium quekettii]